ncbi:MAG: imidazole glycerol phosphate synthase subunit HisH [Cellvibrionaceae bacterium]
MKKPIVGILDYGIGNALSVKNSVTKLNYRTRLVSKKHEFEKINMLIIPGVGAYPAAMKRLHDYDLVDAVKSYVAGGKGLMGICLGMQLLANHSNEQGFTEGLSLIPGDVQSIDQSSWHIGWNTIDVNELSRFNDQISTSSFYFNHSYHFITEPSYVVATTVVTTTPMASPITSIVQKDNVMGVQFHPEKSQLAGLMLLKHSIKESLDV